MNVGEITYFVIVPYQNGRRPKDYLELDGSL